MRRTYELAPRVDAIDACATRIVSDMGDSFADPLIHAAIVEALLNAVVYGALEVQSGDERDVLAFVDAVAAAERRVLGRAVTVTLEAIGDEPTSWCVVVRDPGEGFDVAAALDGETSELGSRGRGLRIMRAGAQALTWNERGNELTLRFGRSTGNERRRGECLDS